MAFESLTAFIEMKGHGPFVWTCYGVFFALMGALIYWSLFQRRRVVQTQRRDMARAAAGADSGRTTVTASFNRINDSQD
ncbi:heme exporter protein CcmD [Marinobacter sp.]|uniref:heme exporter protein CcmD n=1 Tax=Marinobacter sp. TaxID=50741 RepID=UPI0034A2F779